MLNGSGFTHRLLKLSIAVTCALALSAEANETVRFATFNASLNRNAAGVLLTDLNTPNNIQAKAVAEIIQRNNPDILLINEFDYEAAAPKQAAELFLKNYLGIGQNGAKPVHYPYYYVAPSNTGIPSGFDLDNNGSVGGGNDAFGFGNYPGQFGMLVYSKYPINVNQVRTFQNFLWKDMPNALLPDDPLTPTPKDWYSAEELNTFRLSSKSHWDIPVNIKGRIVHVLASHPTPPVFDGPEDRNGTRNHDEIRFWADYVSGGEQAKYIYDDIKQYGGLKNNESFVLMGDMNADPLDGDSTQAAIQQLLHHPLINASVIPTSLGATEQATLQAGANANHKANPAYDTADFADTTPGNLRADYVLPSTDITIKDAKVFWPLSNDPQFVPVGVFPFPSSDHRLVYVDIAQELPNGVASGDTQHNTTLLWARSNHKGKMVFQYAFEPSFQSPIKTLTRIVKDPTIPVEVKISHLEANTQYYYRATDSKGYSSMGKFRTLAKRGDYPAVHFGVTGDWRGELAPYPAVQNVAEQNLDFFIKLGDTIYGDYPSPALSTNAVSLSDYRIKHNEVLASRYGVNSWANVRSATNIFATIDDHEVINDFAGGAAPSTDPRFDNTGKFINETLRYQAGITAFQDYMPIAARLYSSSMDTRFSKKPKLYRSFSSGNTAFVALLDNRSFRDQALPDISNLNDPNEVAKFITAAFDPKRTMLGRKQIDELKYDLRQAQRRGIIWKFIMVPEPIQNLGLVSASDRFEGYAAERTEILKFIEQNAITNVVFVTADIHGTLVNNLTYQNTPFGPQIPTKAWEISTGSVAFDAPFGQTVAGLAGLLGLLTPEQLAFYNSLPVNNDADDVPNDKDDFIKQLINSLLGALGYDPLGLASSPINASLITGDYVAMHTFGWSEFAIDPISQELLVTTYGIKNYTQKELQDAPESVLSRKPAIVSQFRVSADSQK